MATKATSTDRGVRLRKSYEDVLAAGARQPGVAEAIKVYGQFAPYAPAPVMKTAVTRYATGGNG